MKLRDLYEMAFKTGTKFPDYNEDQLKNAVEALAGAKELTKCEDGKFCVIESTHGFYALKRIHDSRILGWVQLQDMTFHNKEYKHINIIYTIPEFRKAGVAFLLLHALKEILHKPLLMDNAVFNDGEAFVNSLLQRKVFSIKTLNKQTGDTKEYQPGDIPLHDNTVSAIIIENIKDGLYGQYLPGSDVKTYFSRFSDLHEQLMMP